MDIQQTNRGVTYSYTIGALSITYLSGKDTDAGTPVFEMSLGELTLENTGDRPINLKYDSSQTFFTGHRFTFGPRAQGAVPDLRPRPGEDPPNPMEYNLAPGQKLLVARRDFMDVVGREGVGVLQNGEVCTQFEAALQVDHVTHAVRFGPHCFQVALDRDWKDEQDRFVQYYLARDRKP